MANAGASIEAVLTLNATGFTKGIETSLSAIQKFQNTLSGFGTKSRAISEGIDALHTHLQQLSSISKENLNTFSRLSTAINKMANGLKILQSDTVNVEQAVNTMNNIFKAFQGTLNGTTVKIQGVANAEKQVATTTNQVSEATRRSINDITQYANATTRATASTQRQASANRTATSSTNQLTSATNRLSKAMSSLRMMGSMVGSMLAYNFAHKLLVATGETIHAKSEMEGYFKMLNFGQGDINHFNQALDRTVSQFQRVNKYSLGETISSIGVEFNLTTEEMEKAMKVTSMITSEYLRAGRNANEASLAVKDVLQGQFQRLSRETGVKGEQLKEAGWSGDTTDVLGLMEALEKVAESRNWDVFAEKANSLNDILTITQNRFGEWSADLVYSVQPAIVGAFNMIMGTAQKFAGVMSGIWEWLNGDGIFSQIAKWGLLATAITSVVSALVVYRTGANLVQVAQMGLTRTITATILGLQAETVAEHGVTASIFSKITGLKAEQVATMGVWRAIATKVLGLNAEMVAHNGVKGAIMSEVIARKLEEASMMGADAVQKAMIVTELQEQIAKRNTLATITAKILGLNMETFAQKGLSVAIWERIAQSKSYVASLIAEKIATMGEAEATLFLVATIGSLLAIIGLVVIAFGSWALALQNSAQQMEKFNNLVDHGADTIKDNRKTVDRYTNSQKALTEQLSKTEKGTGRYYEIQDKLRGVNRDLTVANENLSNSIKAVERANSAQNIFDTTKQDIATYKTYRLAEAYHQMGFSASESYELANDSMREADEGAEQLRQTLQKLMSATTHTGAKMDEFAKQFKETGFNDTDRMKQLTRDYLDARDLYTEGLEKYMTDTSFMGRLDGLFTMTQATVQADITEWTIDWETGNTDELWKDLWTELVADTNFGGLGAINDIFEHFGWDEVWKGFKISTILDPLKSIFEHTFGGGALLELLFGKELDWKTSLREGIGNFIVDSLGEIGVAIQNFFNDPLGSLGISLPDGWSIWSLLGFDTVSASDGSSDHPSILEDLKQGFGLDVQAFIDGMTTDPLGTLGITGVAMDISTFLSQLIPINFESVTGFVQNNLIIPFGQALYNGIMSIPLVGDILALFGLVTGDNTGASQKGADIGNAFKNKVEEIIRNIPIVGDVLQMLGLIPQANPDAHSKGQGVGENIKQGEKEGHTGTAQNVGAEMSDVISAITNAISGAFSAAQGVGQAIWDGINSIIQRASPGFIHDQILAEFGTDIPNAISGSGDVAYTVAQGYGQSVVDGISSVNFNSFGALATDYESDAQTMITTTQLLGLDTTMAFNDMALAVNNTTNTMGTNVIGTYNSMSTQQSSMLQNMKTQNMTAYNDMYQKSNQSLIQMRDSTSNITAQMVSAWSHMKNQIVATANQLKSESTSHFNQLSNTIGEFYRKIQNPANWGANGRSPNAIPSRTSRSSSGRSIANAITSRSGGRFAGGRDVYNRSLGSSTMTIAQLKRKVCPTGTCDIFDGYSATTRVNPAEFLGMFADDYFFGWNDWSSTHYSYIKDKSDQWEMKSPQIQLMGGIDTDAKYKVGDFENGSPQISFESFQSMAESIFSVIPYRLYYNSDWKGSWLGALQAGACNCYDGASALIALANTCGFSGSMGSGSWGSYGHVWAIINGKIMDTTAWQGGYGWTSPKVSGYGAPNISARRPIHNLSENNQSESVKVEVNINGNVYGIDDLDSHISESIDKGLEKHFNKAYTIGV